MLAGRAGRGARHAPTRGRDRESERLLALHRASTALAAQTAEPDAVLDEVLRSAVDLLEAGSASLYLWDAEAELLRCVRNWRVPPEDTTPDLRIGEALAGRTLAGAEPLVVNDYKRWAHAGQSGIVGGMCKGLGVPLRYRGTAIGVLLIRSYRDDSPAFTDDDVRLVTLFADQAATAIENARLYARLETRVARLQHPQPPDRHDLLVARARRRAARDFPGRRRADGHRHRVVLARGRGARDASSARPLRRSDGRRPARGGRPGSGRAASAGWLSTASRS